MQHLAPGFFVVGGVALSCCCLPVAAVGGGVGGGFGGGVGGGVVVVGLGQSS